MPPVLVEILAEYLHDYPRAPNDYLFASPNGEPFRHKNFYRRAFRPAVARLIQQDVFPPELATGETRRGDACVDGVR